MLPRERQQVVNDARRSAGLARYDLAGVAVFGVQIPVGKHQLRKCSDTRERVVQLVSDTTDELSDRSQFLGLNELLMKLLLLRRVPDQAKDFAAALRAGVRDRDVATPAILSHDHGLELPRLSGQRFPKLHHRAGKLGQGEQRSEKATNQLFTRISGDPFARIVDARESTERVEGHDGVAGVLEQMAVA